MRENKRDFLTNVENACLRLRGVSEALRCISSSDYFRGEFAALFVMFSDECELISDMIDERKFTD